MQERRKFIINTLNLFWLIILYYIIGNKGIFLYVLTLSLYNIFTSCFDHITIRETLKRVTSTKTKQKIFKYILLIITIIYLLFLILSVLISDTTSIFLKTDNILLDDSFIPKICDFGFACINASNLKDTPGTSIYKSPEVRQEKLMMAKKLIFFA